MKMCVHKYNYWYSTSYGLQIINFNCWLQKEWEKKANSTWYALTIDDFAGFLYKVIFRTPIYFCMFFFHIYVGSWGLIIYLCMQREVVVDIDEAYRIYNETTPSVERSEQGLGEVISKTHTKIIKNIRTKEFEKLLAVADPENEMEFSE